MSGIAGLIFWHGLTLAFVNLALRRKGAIMTDKKNPHTAGTGTASNTAFTDRNHTALDPLKGWFDLAKPSRERQQKRSWKRGNRGQVDSVLLANILMAVIIVLIVGVMNVRH